MGTTGRLPRRRSSRGQARPGCPPPPPSDGRSTHHGEVFSADALLSEPFDELPPRVGGIRRRGPNCYCCSTSGGYSCSGEFSCVWAMQGGSPSRTSGGRQDPTRLFRSRAPTRLVPIPTSRFARRDRCQPPPLSSTKGRFLACPEQSVRGWRAARPIAIQRPHGIIECRRAQV